MFSLFKKKKIEKPAPMIYISPDLKEGDRVVVQFSIKSEFGKVIGEPYINSAPFKMNNWYAIVEFDDNTKQPCWCKLIQKY